MRRRLSIGFLIWLGLIGAGVGLFFGLQALFPGQLGGADKVDALQMLGWLALVSSGLVYARRIPVRETVRNVAIWVGVLAVALIGYSYRTELLGVFNQVRGELIPAAGVQIAPHTLVVTASEDGGFYVQGSVNGASVRFAIDTGANGVLLSPDDAQRAGIDVSHLSFTSPAQTANGVGFSAPVTVGALDVGPIALTDIPAEVDKTPMTTSLLGMSFLRRLDSFEVQGNHLTLKWRG
jgi:aspartyl protease family protein